MLTFSLMLSHFDFEISSFFFFLLKKDKEAEAPVLWPPDMKSRLTGKDPDAGKN